MLTLPPQVGVNLGSLNCTTPYFYDRRDTFPSESAGRLSSSDQFYPTYIPGTSTSSTTTTSYLGFGELTRTDRAHGPKAELPAELPLLDRNVLLLESDLSARCLVRGQLIKLGAKVMVVQSCEEAICRVGGTPEDVFDLVVADSELLCQMEQYFWKPLGNSRVIVLCRNDLSALTRAISSNLYRRLLAKPLRENELRRVIEATSHPEAGPGHGPKQIRFEQRSVELGSSVGGNNEICSRGMGGAGMQPPQEEDIEPSTPPLVADTHYGPGHLNYSSQTSAFSRFSTARQATIRETMKTSQSGMCTSASVDAGAKWDENAHSPPSLISWDAAKLATQSVNHVQGLILSASDSSQAVGGASLMPATQATPAGKAETPTHTGESTEHVAPPAHNHDSEIPDTLSVPTENLVPSSRAVCTARRAEALSKFREKRKRFTFEKKVRYASRQRLASNRPRVRGQFVRQPVEDPALPGTSPQGPH